MSFRYKKLLQTTAFLLVICLANGSVFAALSDEKSPAGTVRSKDLSSGILNTFGEQSVSVNGNAAFNGMTILSGAVIKTGKNSGARINLRQIGIVELTSESSVKLVFTAEQIDLQVLSGKAKLTAFKGITGTMTDTDGKVLKTDPALEISSIGGWETTLATAALSVPAASSGLFGMGIFGTIAAVGGVVGASTAAWFAARAGNTEEGTLSNVQP